MTHPSHTPATGSFFWPASAKNKNGNAKNHRFPRFSRFSERKPLTFNGLLFIINFSFFSFFSLLIKGKRWKTRRNEIENGVQNADIQSIKMKTRKTMAKPHSIWKNELPTVNPKLSTSNTFAR